MKTHFNPDIGQDVFTIKVRVDLGTGVPREMYKWLIDFKIDCNAHLMWLYLHRYNIHSGETHFVIEFMDKTQAAHFKLVWSDYVV
jgi:hypothetical protein